MSDSQAELCLIVDSFGECQVEEGEVDASLVSQRTMMVKRMLASYKSRVQTPPIFSND